ncbi:MAG: glycosyltransferase family 2 protein [Bacilli bacterium]|nr:glycosyltransferase family 2 protein [Bacilli bacterium]
MIDIIIAAYNAHNTIEKALNSIIMQNISDMVNVYIINDKSDTDYSDVIEKYSKYLNVIELTYGENKGPGFARNYGIDHSSSQYIVFLDSDDIFSTPYALESLYKRINNSSYDVVISNFLEEVGDDRYIPHFNDNIWDHGKIYRRSYIQDNNIRFTDERSNEDLFFNFLIILTGAKVSYIDNITYIWQNNNDSITRKNNHEFSYKGIEGYIRNIYNLSLSLEERNAPKSNIAKVLFFALLQMYYTYLFFDRDNKIEAIDILMSSTKQVAARYTLFKDFLSLDDENEIINKEISKYTNSISLSLVTLPNITFNQFLSEVSNYGKK